jgi:hypothetical protein
VSKRADLAVKYAVKAFTDADADSDLGREVTPHTLPGLTNTALSSLGVGAPQSALVRHVATRDAHEFTVAVPRLQVYLAHGRALKPSLFVGEHGDASAGQAARRALLTAPPAALARRLVTPVAPNASAASPLSGLRGSGVRGAPLMQWHDGPPTLVQRAEHQRCMFWVGPKYQTCLAAVREVWPPDFPPRDSHTATVVLQTPAFQRRAPLVLGKRV